MKKSFVCAVFFYENSLIYTVKNRKSWLWAVDQKKMALESSNPYRISLLAVKDDLRYALANAAALTA